MNAEINQFNIKKKPNTSLLLGGYEKIWGSAGIYTIASISNRK